MLAFLSWGFVCPIDRRNVFTQLVWIFTGVVVSACQPQGNERLREKTGIEADEQFQKVDSRARLVESTLQTQRRFYSAVEGVYQGLMIEDSEPEIISGLDHRTGLNKGIASGIASDLEREFRVDARIFRKFPPPPPLNRAPTLEELSTELNSLAFDVLIRPSSATNRNGAAGCIAEGVKPNLNLGLISILRETCPNGATLQLAEFDSTELTQRSLRSNRIEDWKAFIPRLGKASSEQVSQRILRGELDQLQVLQGRVILLSRQVEYRIFLFRVQEVLP
ncbi:MAG: hypothetical protein WCH11_02130 [Bdellovibrio sp.]